MNPYVAVIETPSPVVLADQPESLLDWLEEHSCQWAQDKMPNTRIYNGRQIVQLLIGNFNGSSAECMESFKSVISGLDVVVQGFQSFDGSDIAYALRLGNIKEFFNDIIAYDADGIEIEGSRRRPLKADIKGCVPFWTGQEKWVSL